MGIPGVDEAVEAFEAAAAEFVACARLGLGGRGSETGAGGADPLREQADACLDALAESARVEAMVAAFRVRLAAGFAEKSLALAAPAVSPGQHTAQEMGVVSEVACVLTVGERSASALLAQSLELTTALPLTLAALQGGSISWQHARIMVDETTGLDRDGAASLEARFLGPDAPARAGECPAGELVPSRFRHKARAWRERHHPVSIEKRHAKGVLDRRVEYVPDRDGMAWLSAYLPADQAAGIWNGLTAAARALQGPAEDRTMTQMRADIAATLLLNAGNDAAGNGNAGIDSPGTNTAGNDAAGIETASQDAPGNDTAADSAANDHSTGRVPSPGAQVLVTVPVFALMGLTDEPATLDGYGPVPASMARKLVADGATSFHRVLTDPRNGAPLEIGRDSYRIPTAMRQWLRLRDGKCPFPGCNNHSLDNEADHLLAWADGGTTGISNLGQPCPKHHRLKHATAWTPTQATKDTPPGWISPTGRHYQSEHQDWEPPWLPPQILALEPDQEHSPALPKDAPKEVSKARPKEVHKAVHKALPKALPKEVPRAASRAVPKAMPPARPKEVPEAVHKALSKAVPKDVWPEDLQPEWTRLQGPQRVC